jgi:hypothetical protein
VNANLSHTSLVGLAALVEERLKIPVVHFILGSESFFPTGIRRHEPLKALGIAADSTLIVNSLTVEANYTARAEAAGMQYSESVDGPLLAPAAAAAAEASHEKNADAAAAAAAAASDDAAAIAA